MNRRELVLALSERLDVDRKSADQAVAAFVDIVTENVAKGEPVSIPGFAKFYRQDRAARMGRNPATGEAIKIPAKRVAKITPLKAFKDAALGAKKAAAKKTAAKKAPAKKVAAKKTAAKKTAARR